MFFTDSFAKDKKRFCPIFPYFYLFGNIFCPMNIIVIDQKILLRNKGCGRQKCCLKEI